MKSSRRRNKTPAGEPHLPGLVGDVTRHTRQVTRDGESVVSGDEVFDENKFSLSLGEGKHVTMACSRTKILMSMVGNGL